MDPDAGRARPANEALSAPPDRAEQPRSSLPADEAEAGAGPEPEDSTKITFGDERLKESVREGMGVVIFFVGVAGALWYWIGASSENSFLMAMLHAFWPWGLLAMFAGGLVQGTRGAMRLSQESDEKPIESGEGFVLAVGAMCVLAKGVLKETKEDGQSLAKVLVVLAAIVLLLLVFAPSALEEIKRWLESHL